MTALKRLFSEGFRLFFLLSAVWGTVAMLVWGLWLAVHALRIIPYAGQDQRIREWARKVAESATPVAGKLD